MPSRKIRNEELNNSIRCSKTENSPDIKAHNDLAIETTRVNELLVYTITGKQDDYVDGFPVLTSEKNEESNLAYAKQKNNKFYIKSNGGRLLDPCGMYEADLYKKIGDMNYARWVLVSPKTFNYYLKYLQTKNKSYYHNAMREI